MKEIWLTFEFFQFAEDGSDFYSFYNRQWDIAVCAIWKQLYFGAYTNNQQWQIQYFPEECTNSEGGINLLFGIIFGKNCMKVKKNWIARGRPSFESSRSTIVNKCVFTLKYSSEIFV